MQRLFDTGSQISGISYDSCKEFAPKTRINTKVKPIISLAVWSNLGPIGVVICSLILGTYEFEHKYIAYKIYCTLYFRIRLTSRF